MLFPIFSLNYQQLYAFQGDYHFHSGSLDAQTTATVTVTLQTAAGVDVGGQTWPAPMAHVAAGTYRATLDADLEVTHAARYVAVVDVLTAGGVIGHWEAPVVARTRTS